VKLKLASEAEVSEAGPAMGQQGEERLWHELCPSQALGWMEARIHAEPRLSPRHSSAETATSYLLYVKKTNTVQWERPYFSPSLNDFCRCAFEKICSDLVRLSKNNLPTVRVVIQNALLSDLAASSNGR